MSLPIRVLPGQVVASGNASLNGIEGFGDSQFGTILDIFEETTFKIGDYIMFYLKDCDKVNWLGDTYFLLNESDIKLVETILP
jgi:hypothetical protein